MLHFDHYTIRFLRPDDLQVYYGLIDRNRPRLEDFFAGTVALTKTLEDTRAHVQDVLQKLQDKNHFPFVVIDDSTDTLIASIQVKGLDWSIPKGELGYYIDAGYEGKGIVTKAMGYIIRWCFEELKLAKVFIRTHERNISSRRVAERNGLVLEGTIRMDYKTTRGEVVDLMYYGMLKEEYSAREVLYQPDTTRR